MCMIAVIGLLFILAVRGFGHFWPATIIEAVYYDIANENQPVPVLGQLVETKEVSLEQLQSAGMQIESVNGSQFMSRHLMKVGNRDITGQDFVWVLQDYLHNIEQPRELVVIERREWGNFYGRVEALKKEGDIVWQAQAGQAFDRLDNPLFEEQFSRVKTLIEAIDKIEKEDISSINHGLERLRLKERRLALDYGGPLPDNHVDVIEIKQMRIVFNKHYESLQKELARLYEAISRDTLIALTADGKKFEIPLAKIVHVFQPNAMSLPDKMAAYLYKLVEFLTDEPREANTEGGIFPAIFGTVMMVILMAVMVTPFGVVAAVYLHEYAKQGMVTRLIRVAVNNLAGVPSIVYGVFGLGFFVYFIGGNIDTLFFPEAKPAPTFGTPGMLWASLTLALLTLPVVIVATEEGLARIPRSIREGSLALGATKAETLWRIIIPMASPAMMTGLILAVARAAGEVAPLMLVGVVKLAPSLPIDGNYPFVHLDQKFMHLGFHIYDVGFQSPNVEAARPLVYATSLLLVAIIAILNFSAVVMRNHLREKYKSLES